MQVYYKKQSMQQNQNKTIVNSTTWDISGDLEECCEFQKSRDHAVFYELGLSFKHNEF